MKMVSAAKFARAEKTLSEARPFGVASFGKTNADSMVLDADPLNSLLREDRPQARREG